MSSSRIVQVSITVSGLTLLFGDDLAGVLDAARATDDSGIDQLVLDSTLESVPGLEALGVTMVSLGMGRFLRDADDVAQFFTEVGAECR